jgi:hypothetical protein
MVMVSVLAATSRRPTSGAERPHIPGESHAFTCASGLGIVEQWL